MSKDSHRGNSAYSDQKYGWSIRTKWIKEVVESKMLVDYGRLYGKDWQSRCYYATNGVSYASVYFYLCTVSCFTVGWEGMRNAYAYSSHTRRSNFCHVVPCSLEQERCLSRLWVERMPPSQTQTRSTHLTAGRGPFSWESHINTTWTLNTYRNSFVLVRLRVGVASGLVSLSVIRACMTASVWKSILKFIETNLFVSVSGWACIVWFRFKKNGFQLLGAISIQLRTGRA